ncbi:MAG: hypothetical protein IJV99_02715 [Clostridia bacterium]|nr:hypothetical protein [Clostridia bacterium]
MSITLIILLCLDGALLLGLISYIAGRAARKPEETACTCACAEAKAEPVVEEAKEEPVAEKDVVVETVVEEVKEEPVAEPVVEEVKEEPVVEETAVAEVAEEADDEDVEKIRRIPFSEKLLVLDPKVHGYYDEINNKFKSMRKINARVSTKGVSYRLGRELVAKLTIRGKTMKLHLALDVNKFEEKIYFQKDLSDVKAYVEVPFTVKVRSDRGMKNASKLIDALVEAKGIEYKTRFNQVDSIAQIKDIIVNSVIADK